MTPIDRLLAIEEIKQLKARYFRCMDQKKWDEFEAVFTPDVVFDLREAIFARNPATGEIMKSGDSSSVKIRSRTRTGYTMGRRPCETGRRGADRRRHRTSGPHAGNHDHVSDDGARLLAHGAPCFVSRESTRTPSSGGSRTTAPFHQLHGFGLYDETYKRLEQGWRIKTLKLTHFRVDIT